MSISSYVSEAGETLWKAYVCVRSELNPTIRVQLQKSFPTEKEAQKAEALLEREASREVLKRETQGSSWWSVMDAWHTSLADDPSVNEMTRQDYWSALKNHTHFWSTRPAIEINRADVKDLLQKLKDQGHTNGFRNRMKNIIHRIFIYGIETRMIKGLEHSPAYGIKIARNEEKKPEILTIGEVQKLLKHARELKHPWYPIWAMALLTGMRSGELYALLWTDVDWENQALTVTKSYNGRLKLIKSTKSGDWRTVPISSDLLGLLKELKAEAKERPQVLPRMAEWTKGGQAKVLRNFCLGIGLPSIRFHALRACFATQLIRMGIAPIKIQKICGWKDLETMQRYIRLAGIEVEGITEGLKILPDAEIMAQVVNLFTKEPVRG